MVITYEVFKRLMDAVWYANGLREHRAANGKATVFCDFSGHIGGVYVRIYPNGWAMDSDDYEAWRLYSFTPLEVWEEAIKAVESLIHKEE